MSQVAIALDIGTFLVTDVMKFPLLKIKGWRKEIVHHDRMKKCND